jgi:hypothetical protein
MSSTAIGSQRYRRTEVLGEDRLGTLWRGTDVQSGSAVTLRVLDERLTPETPAVQRLGAQLQRVQRIGSNAHLPRLLDVRLAERPAVVVFEGSGRETVARHLERVGALSPERALRVVAAVADGLASAHDVWVSHGALSTSSVLLDDVVVAKVLDIGLGELLDRDQARRPSHAPNLVDQRAADVLAVGLLFERLVSGPGERPPSPELDAPRAWEPSVPPEVRAVLRGALSPHWLRRPGMAEVAASLAPFLAAMPEEEGPALAHPAPAPALEVSARALPGEPPPPPRPDRSEAPPAAAEPGPAREAAPGAAGVSPTPRRRRRLLLAALLGALLVIGGSAGAFLALRPSGGERERPAGGGAGGSPGAASVTPSVGPGLQPATVPGVLGVRVERASELLQQAGLVVGSVTTVPGKAGVVVRSEPTQGEAVAAGSAVDLFVGNGSEP